MHPPPLDHAQRQALFEKCLRDVVGDAYPRGWFLDPEIKRENVIDWIFWAIFSCDRADAAPEWRAEAEYYLVAMEQHLEVNFEDGHNEAAKSMRLTLDPVLMAHRPLLWYGVSDHRWPDTSVL